uniref:Uncharacterized protein n=1 Tax=Cyanistes caeruleus TaxID=156563 RepID=A0A8C0ZHV6_CYACU
MGKQQLTLCVEFGVRLLVTLKNGRLCKIVLFLFFLLYCKKPTQSASLCTNTLNIGCLLDTNLTFPLHLKNTKRLSWKNYGNKLGREARYFSKGFSRQVSICKSHSHHGSSKKLRDLASNLEPREEN